MDVDRGYHCCSTRLGWTKSVDVLIQFVGLNQCSQYDYLQGSYIAPVTKVWRE